VFNVENKAVYVLTLCFKTYTNNHQLDRLLLNVHTQCLSM